MGIERIREKEEASAEQQTLAKSQAVRPLIPPSRLIQLQQSLGNRAFGRLFKAGVIQAKLKIGRPGDEYEQEADRVAEAVTRMPEPKVRRRKVENEEEEDLIQPKPLAEQITPLIQRQVDEEEEEVLLAKQVSGQTPDVTPELEVRIRSLQGGGQPLPEAERAFFEPRFGYDFSRVRLHTDVRATDTAQAVSARAFTTGHDVVFGVGEYLPGMVAGRRLLAHELAHVVQQTRVDAANKRVQRKLESLGLGGEVTNDTDIPWLISGKSNREVEDFIWLPPGKNSDDLNEVEAQLNGDVDAVWPNGVPVKNADTDEIVSDGVFKLSDLRNTNIEGDAEKGYQMSDFSNYFSEGKFPKGWELPSQLKRTDLAGRVGKAAAKSVDQKRKSP